jgi:hypothetical protein
MHWLLANGDTFRVLDDAGYSYDTTAGYNETAGYRAGTGQVYRPPGVRRLLELPLHIQDGALFNPERSDLSEAEAWELCSTFTRHARAHGGVLTVLWHDRSHGPERFWGDFYARLVGELKTLNVWFGTAGEVTEWFRARRSVTFERGSEGRVVARLAGERPGRSFVLRQHCGGSRTDSVWSGEGEADIPAHSDVERFSLSAS